MPIANIRGVAINYEIVGDHGPWLALMPGGRRGYQEFVSLAGKIAKHGYRVLLHDRRNTGASDVSFDGSDAEDAIWAEDLHALLSQLKALPAFVGGSSSGCRTALLFYLRHRVDVRGLVLFRVTGGEFAAKRLPVNYYDQFITAAEKGGMAAVSAMDHWRERVSMRPENAERLKQTSSDAFLSVMKTWRDHFMAGVDMPVLGVSEPELRSIAVPTIVIPGNDRIHSGPSGRVAQSLIPNAQLHELPIKEADADLVPFEDWAPQEDEMAQAFADFMKGAAAQKSAAA